MPQLSSRPTLWIAVVVLVFVAPSAHAFDEPPLRSIDTFPQARQVDFEYINTILWKNVIEVEVGYNNGIMAFCGYHAGMKVFDVSNPTNPTEVASLTLPGEIVADILLDGTCAYIANYNGGLHIVEMADPHSPKIIASAATKGPAMALDVTRGYAYVCLRHEGLQVFDVRTPSNPVRVASLDTQAVSSRSVGISISGNYAYVAEGEAGLTVFDVRSPSNPRQIARLAVPHSAMYVLAYGDYVYVSTRIRGLQVIDASDPTNPRIVNSFPTKGYSAAIKRHETYLLIMEEGGAVQILDVSVPAYPRDVFRFLTPSRGTARVATYADYAFIADLASLEVYDIVDIRAPAVIGSIDASGYRHAAFVGDYLFASRKSGHVEVYDASDPWHITLDTTFTNLGPVSSFVVTDDLAYLSCDDTIRIMSLSDPLAPVELGAFPRGPWGAFAAFGHHLCLVNSDSLGVVDVSVPSRPLHVGTWKPPFDHIIVQSRGAITDNIVALHIRAVLGMPGRNEPLRFISIEDPEHPRTVGGIGYSMYAYPSDFAFSDSTLYVLAWPSGLTIYRVTPPFTLSDSVRCPKFGTDHDVYQAIAVEGDRAVISKPYKALALNTGSSCPSVVGEASIGADAVWELRNGYAWFVGGKGISVYHVFDAAEIQTHFASGQAAKVELENYPNPFNATTTIRYSLTAPAHVGLSVYNILGQRVSVLIDGPEGLGDHKIQWDGRDSRGCKVGSGVYFLVLRAGDQRYVKRAMVLK